MKHILQRMMGKRVLVIGDVMLDKYIWGNVSRISPEAPVQIVDVHRESYTVGGAANTAANINSLDGEGLLVGVVGDDTTWNHLQGEMNKRMMSTKGIVVDSSRRTTRKVRVMGGKQQLIRFDYETREDISDHIQQRIIETIYDVIEDIEVVLISDYAKGVITQPLYDAVIQLAQQKHLKVIVDPKPSNKVNYSGAFLITPNLKEACELAGWSDCPDTKIKELGKKLQTDFRCSLLITRGEKGMMLFEGDSVIDVETKAKEVYDVSGAGDTVVATVGLSLAAGSSLRDAALLANHAAGIVVGKLGTSSVTREELEMSLDD